MAKDEALKMAIECLEYHHEHSEIWGHDVEGTIQACKEALEQPAQEVGAAEIKQMLDDIEYYKNRLAKYEDVL